MKTQERVDDGGIPLVALGFAAFGLSLSLLVLPNFVTPRSPGGGKAPPPPLNYNRNKLEVLV